MCGKFTQMMSWSEVHDLSDLVGRTATEEGRDKEDFTTPMRFAEVIYLDAAGKRRTGRMRWGFSDLNATTPIERPKHMHARGETIDQLPTFRGAFANARGIVLTKTFNIGEELANGKTRQWTIAPRDGKPIPLGVIFERWTHRTEGELLCFVMVTTAVSAQLSRLTDRMPYVVQPDRWARWLGEAPASTAELKDKLMPFEGDWRIEPSPLRGSNGRAFDPKKEPTLF
jgi:putative SOS response-associated peptidase YedK